MDVIAIHYNIGIADVFAAIRVECQGYSIIYDYDNMTGAPVHYTAE